jgi:hypothetical protein
LKKWTFSISMAWAMAYVPCALGDEFEGQIRNSGSSVNQIVEVVSDNTQNSQKLCLDDTASRVKRLTGLTIKVSGDWKINKTGQKQCLQVKSFTILKHSSGRTPLVGTLQNENGVFVVTAEDGKKQTLDEVSSGLKKLSGKKVILDVKPLDASSDKSSVLKVVTYREYPE